MDVALIHRLRKVVLFLFLIIPFAAQSQIHCACTGHWDDMYDGVIGSPIYGCPPYTTHLSLHALRTTGPGTLAFQWQSSPNNVTWTNISGATDSTYNAVVTGNMYYSCIAGCAGGYGYSYSGCAVSLYGFLVHGNIPPITGPPALCLGSTSTLTDLTPGGTWTSSNPSVASIDIISGVVSGITTGSAIITYSVSTCSVTKTITVYSAVPSITGSTSICAGSTATLSNTVSGGVWNSSNTAVATIGTSSGVVTGLATGTSVITYTIGGTCYTTTTITVKYSPTAILGAAPFCRGGAISLTNAVAGGSWSSSNTSVATVTILTGVVQSVAAGIVNISYTLSSGCSVFVTLTVTPMPSVITGQDSVCSGEISLLTNAVPGGTWSSSNAAVATIGSGSGLVYGVSAGATIITYNMGFGCYVLDTVTLSTSPSPITGITSICVGSSATLVNFVSGGTWSSSVPAVASISAGSGVYTGVSAGSAVITYMLTSGCFTTRTVSVFGSLGGISGSLTTTVGGTTTLSVTIPGGVWTSGSTLIASVGAGTGIVTGVWVGTANITYSVGASCTAIVTVTVNPAGCSGQIISTFAGTGSAGFGGDGGPATAAQISTPWGIAIDGSGNIYFTDYGNRRIRKINTSGVISTVAGNGVTGFSGDGGPATAATMRDPTGIAVDATGNIYFVDCFNERVRKINMTTGIITTVAGTGIGGYSGDGGPATAARISHPNGIAVDGGGNIYIPDQLTARVRKISAAGIISTIGGTGVPGYSGDGGPAVSARLNNPNDIAVDAYGNIYVSEYLNQRVRKIDPSGIISTYAGNGVMGFSGDGGPATASQIQGIAGLDVNTLGDLFIADMYNQRVRKVNSSGIISSLAGNGSAGYSGDGGLALAAKLNQPEKTIHDTRGNVYITELSNHRIRKVSLGNKAPLFINGLSQSMSVCQNSIAVSIDTLLAAIDTDFAQVETWALLIPPVHGTVSVGYTAISTGGVLLPTGNLYSPAFGYVGADSFKVQVFDCAGGYGYATIHVAVTPFPTPITGTTVFCAGDTTTLSNATPGGTWASGTVAVDTISSATGFTAAVAAGTSVITYSMPAGCGTTTTVTVFPVPAAITGADSVCAGFTVPLHCTTAGGTWSSSNATIASAGSVSGVVRGVAAGTVFISYVMPSGCYSLTSFTVNPLPVPITGVTLICAGTTSVLYNGTPGGSWSSRNPSVASIDASGIVSGLSGGTTVITYALPTGCSSTVVFKVYAAPAAIAGVNHICTGGTTLLTDATPGGTWTSSAPGVATVGSGSGLVTGVTTGSAIISYSLGLGTACIALDTVMVYPLPSPVVGPGGVCRGSTTTLINAVTGGIWTSSNTTVAVIGSVSGILTGVIAGTTIITYSFSVGCIATKVVTVHPVSPVTGVAGLCVGISALLTDATPGGTWISASPATASVSSSSGLVTGVSAGSAFITYQLPTGCYATTVVAINSVPPPITGPARLCVGTSTLLTGSGGGMWSSSSPATASVDAAAGIVYGIAVGTARITYSLGTGCLTSSSIAVMPLPSAISGAATVCQSASIALSCATAGGSWSSSNTSIATVGSGTGVVSGISSGTVMITYTVAGTGCSAFKTVTVLPLPPAITGITGICNGSTSLLSNTAPGGTWSTGSAGIASVAAGSGVVTAVSTGTANITYTLSTGCRIPVMVTVYPLPPAIIGAAHLCLGNSSLFTNAAAGGTWSSSDPGVASIGPVTGIVTGLTAGTAVITYMLSTGCIRTASVVVDPAPAAITGAAHVCAGMTAVLANSASGGTWSSSNPSVCTVHPVSGTATGVAAGSVTISYLLPSGCSVTTVFTVDPLPPPISGITHVCEGAVTALSNPLAGGTWSAGAATIATIHLVTGIATGVSAGTTSITYIQGGCAAVTTLTVQPLPLSITGSLIACTGLTNYLADATLGGTWSSSNSAVATITMFTGMVTGVVAGITTIAYTLPTGCAISRIETINLLPPPITGPPIACVGRSTILHNSSPGGSWTSSDISIATVVSGPVSSGIVTGSTAGSVLISYTLMGCPVATTVIINRLPAPITGIHDMCAWGSVMSVYDADTPYGTWNSASVTISTSGIVLSHAPGPGIITYTLPTGCLVTATVNVNPLPIPASGPSYACIGVPAFFTDATPGGTWSCPDTTIARVGAYTGIVTGVSSGFTTITYTLPTGCMVTRRFAVDPLPSGIAGVPNLCVNLTSVFLDSATGGSWASSNSSIATIGSGSGIVTGVAAGVVTLTYTNACGRSYATKTLTIDPLPDAGALAGPGSVCQDAAIIWIPTVPGGAWGINGTGAVSLDTTTGRISGIILGSDVITYSITNNCGIAVTTRSVSVDPLPNAGSISGPSEVCSGTTIALTDLVPGGVWSSSNGSVSVTAGIVSALYAGSDSVRYAVANSCGTAIASKTVTILALPDAGTLSGNTEICVGQNTLVTPSRAGGVWTRKGRLVSLDPGVGECRVSGSAPGIDTINYTISNTCGSDAAKLGITVNPIPDAGTLSGPDSVCVGDSILLHTTVSGGTWVTGNVYSSVSSTGFARGIAPGPDTIGYSVTAAGCHSCSIHAIGGTDRCRM